MTSMNVNPQPDLLPAAPFSDMEKSRPPTEIFLYPYLVIGNCLFIETVVKGTAVKKKLCNFSAWIIGEVIRYNGIDTEVWVRVEGIHASGRKLPVVTVPLNKLSSFEWVDQWGADCILEVGGSVREHIVKAVRETVYHAERKQEFAVTGWKQIGEKLEFLMPGSSNLAVNLPAKLGGYYLSDQCTDEDVKILASLMECKLVPPDILYPLLAYIFLSPLIEFLRRGGCVPKFVLFLVGKTGSRKSTLAALMLSFFGRFTATELPLSFRDTPNSIVHYAFSLKDVAPNVYHINTIAHIYLLVMCIGEPCKFNIRRILIIFAVHTLQDIISFIYFKRIGNLLHFICKTHTSTNRQRLHLVFPFSIFCSICA